MKEDKDNVEKVKKGNKEAFKPLMKKYYKRMMYYARNVTGMGNEDCQDIVSTVFVKAYTGIHLYNPEYAFSTWLYRIAHNESVTFLRKNNKIKWVQLNEDISGHDVYLEIEGKEILKNAFSKLTQYEVSILTMHYAEGMKYQEIAKVVDKAPGTIALHVLRAKKKLTKSKKI